MEGSDRCHISVYLPDIRLEGLTKTTKPLSQNSRCRGRDSNEELSESKSETIPLKPSCFVRSFKCLKNKVKISL
jgi:hypothetical protein